MPAPTAPKLPTPFCPPRPDLAGSRFSHAGPLCLCLTQLSTAALPCFPFFYFSPFFPPSSHPAPHPHSEAPSSFYSFDSHTCRRSSLMLKAILDLHASSRAKSVAFNLPTRQPRPPSTPRCRQFTKLTESRFPSVHPFLANSFQISGHLTLNHSVFVSPPPNLPSTPAALASSLTRPSSELTATASHI